MKIILYCCFLLSSLTTPSFADDAKATMLPSDIPVEAFAKLNDGEQMKMSPSATLLAYIVSYQGRKHIMVQKLDGTDRTILPPIKDADISWFIWKGDDILLISYRFTEKNMGRTWATSRLVTYNLTTMELDKLIHLKKDTYMSVELIGNIGDDVLDMLEDDPDHILLALDIERDGDKEIFKVNLRTKKRKRFFGDKYSVSNWRVDEQHKVRWGTGYPIRAYSKKHRVVRYLNPVTSKWDQIHKKEWYDEDSTYPMRFFEDPRYAYVSSPNEKGINGLAKFDFVDGKIIKELYSHKTVDISELATSPETGDVIGVYYTEHLPKIHFFNKSYEKLYGRIDDAFGVNEDLVSGRAQIISMNLKKKRFIIKYMNSNTAGEYHFLNGNTGNILHILNANEYLPQTLMSKVKPIQYEARDGLTIHGYLTLPKGKAAKNLPTVILPHGGPNARDTMAFDVWAQFFASRGYAVLQPNFRGSTGYGDIFKDLGDNQWGGTMQDDITDGTKWLIEQGIANPSRICIVGASYGGYAALMGSIKEPDLYKCAISINGVADLMAMARHDKQFIGGKIWVKGRGLKGESIKTVSPYHRAKDIKIPVLIVHSKDDPVVPYKQGKGMYKRLKYLKNPVTYVEVDNGDHFLDTAETRLAAFKAMEKFLAKHLD